MRMPEYILLRDVEVNMGPFKGETIPAGSHVRPIKYEYLPKHTKEESAIFYNPKDWEYCHTRFGITAIKPVDIRRVI